MSQWASEGMDEPSLNLTDLTSATPIDQDALVEAVAAANPHTIVVVESGGPILMPWLSQVSAVLEAWYPGQSGGPAIADLLFGVTNPSGKLPITFPASEAQLPRPVIPQPPDDVTPFAVNYTEGYNVGYKWYDVNGFTPLFPFGFGLSYTTFSITNAAIVNNLSSTTNRTSRLLSIWPTPARWQEPRWRRSIWDCRPAPTSRPSGWSAGRRFYCSRAPRRRSPSKWIRTTPRIPCRTGIPGQAVGPSRRELTLFIWATHPALQA